jgi:hypothetical protein
MPYGPPPREPWERFIEKVEVASDGCWLWTGARFSNGYGRISWSRKQSKTMPVLAHRLSYLLFYGWLPDGYETVLDHLCRVKHCVNPEHLQVVSQGENLHRGVGVHKDFCSKGHAMVGDNLKIVRHRGYDDWLCQTCRLDVYRAYESRHPERKFRAR